MWKINTIDHYFLKLNMIFSIHDKEIPIHAVKLESIQQKNPNPNF
jgi:hypothetical protein